MDGLKPIQPQHSRTHRITKMPVVLLALLSLLSSVQAYLINIDSGVENECYHERVPIGVKLGLSYEVLDGGFFDIDVSIRDPDNVILHDDTKASSGSYTIKTDKEGAYQFCFSNKKTSNTPKLVIFDIERSDIVKPSSSGGEGEEGKTDDETTKLMGMVESLLLATISSRHDVRYLTARDRVHRRINEATNARIVWWSAIEFILLLSVSLGQVWYLRRFFEIRRKA